MLAFARRGTSALTEGLLIALLIALVSALVGLAGVSDAARSKAEDVGPTMSVAAGMTRGRVLVSYKKDTTKAAKKKAEAAVGASLVAAIPEIGVRILEVSPGRERDVAKQLASSRHVRYAELDGRATAADTTPNDPYFLSQASTSLTQVRAPTAWDTTTGAAGFVVAVVDSGVSSHADLAGKVLPGQDFVNNDNDASDDHGHGTHVAGIVAATANNGLGVAGLCWGCRVLPVKVLDGTGNGSYSAIASGITWAADQGARVINLSLGGTSASSTLKAAVDYAAGKGAIVVAATGNQGCACVLYPAAYSNALAVGAVDKYNVLRSYSNTGPEVDVVAPGSNWTTSVTVSGGYAAFSGTSSATPVVSSLAALIWSSDGSWSAGQVRQRLSSTTVDLGPAGQDPSYGAGLVDFAAAVGNEPTPAPSPSATASPPGATPTPSPTAGGSPAPAPTASPTPAPTASPQPSPTPTPQPSPAPTPTPTPVPSPTPSAVTKTFKGAVNAKQPTKDFAIKTGAGSFSATITAGDGLALMLLDSTGSMVATSQSATVDADLDRGSYVLRVSGNGAKVSFKVSVRYPAP